MTLNDRSASSALALPRSRRWWLGLALLLVLAGWLYLRGYDVSLPFIRQHDEAQNLLEAQHIIDMGHARGVFRESYPPGLRLVTYPILKHLKPAGAHHGTMVAPMRLITIGAWLLVIPVMALIGAMVAGPPTGLMAAAFWIVNPWVVYRAHYVMPDGYNTLFTLLAIWLALLSYCHRRRSFSTAAAYSIMLAIAFKTQAIVVAPFVLLLPLLNGWRSRAWRKEAWRQTFWNCLRFAIFLFWLLLIYPTLDAPRDIYRFPVTDLRIITPSLQHMADGLSTLMRTMLEPLELWLFAAVGFGLLWRYWRRINGVAFLLLALSALAWLVGTHLLPTRGFSLRQYYGMAAMLALLYAIGLRAIIHALDELLRRLLPGWRDTAIAASLPAGAVILCLALALLPNYQESDALARNYSLHDRRNDLMHYMDTSLPPGKYISDRDGPYHKVFNRSWGGYDGVHEYPLARTLRRLPERSIEMWRDKDAVYAIMPYEQTADGPLLHYPDETFLLKGYPPDPEFRDPGMVVLSLYPMQYEGGGQLGSIELVGFDLNATELTAGEDIVVRHYWRAEAATASVQRVFNHLLDAEGAIATQTDYVPLWDDRRPTTRWDDPEEILLGRDFILSLPPDLPAGDYQLVSGFYDPLTWQRLSSPDGADSLRIAEITISAAEI